MIKWLKSLFFGIFYDEKPLFPADELAEIKKSRSTRRVLALKDEKSLYSCHKLISMFRVLCVLDAGFRASFYLVHSCGRRRLTFAVFMPVHQPAGLAIEETEDTSASSVLSGNVTRALRPSLMRSMMDS